MRGAHFSEISLGFQTGVQLVHGLLQIRVFELEVYGKWNFVFHCRHDVGVYIESVSFSPEHSHERPGICVLTDCLLACVW